MAWWQIAGQREGRPGFLGPKPVSQLPQILGYSLASDSYIMEQRGTRFQETFCKAVNWGSVEETANHERNPQCLQRLLERRLSPAESVETIMLPYGANRHQVQTPFRKELRFSTLGAVEPGGLFLTSLPLPSVPRVLRSDVYHMRPDTPFQTPSPASPAYSGEKPGGLL